VQLSVTLQPQSRTLWLDGGNPFGERKWSSSLELLDRLILLPLSRMIHSFSGARRRKQEDRGARRNVPKALDIEPTPLDNGPANQWVAHQHPIRLEHSSLQGDETKGQFIALAEQVGRSNGIGARNEGCCASLPIVEGLQAKSHHSK